MAETAEKLLDDAPAVAGVLVEDALVVDESEAADESEEPEEPEELEEPEEPLPVAEAPVPEAEAPVPEAVAEPNDEEAVPVAVAVPEAVPEEVELGVSKVVGQVRLKRGEVERSLVMANFMVLAEFESRRLYQKVLTLLKRRRQPTSSQ